MGKNASSSRSKDVILVKYHDTRFQVMGDLYGRVEHTIFTNGNLFPNIRSTIFMENITLPSQAVINIWKPEFEPLQDSILTNLLYLLTFRIAREVVRCTKFLIGGIHGQALSLDRAYPISIIDIHALTSLLMKGRDILEALQDAI